MNLQITRKGWLTATNRGGFITSLAGYSSDSDDTLVDGEGHSREYWRFDLAEGDRIDITVRVVERPSFGDGVHIDVEAVANGVVAGWELSYRDDEDTFPYTAETDAEHTLKVYQAGIAEVSVEVVDDD